jgi:hypothetical protein
VRCRAGNFHPKRGPENRFGAPVLFGPVRSRPRLEPQRAVPRRQPRHPITAGVPKSDGARALNPYRWTGAKVRQFPTPARLASLKSSSARCGRWSARPVPADCELWPVVTGLELRLMRNAELYRSELARDPLAADELGVHADGWARVLRGAGFSEGANPAPANGPRSRPADAGK